MATTTTTTKTSKTSTGAAPTPLGLSSSDRDTKLTICQCSANMYRGYRILWLSDYVTDWILWLFFQFPVPDLNKCKSYRILWLIGFYDCLVLSSGSHRIWYPLYHKWANPSMLPVTDIHCSILDFLNSLTISKRENHATFRFYEKLLVDCLVMRNLCLQLCQHGCPQVVSHPSIRWKPSLIFLSRDVAVLYQCTFISFPRGP